MTTETRPRGVCPKFFRATCRDASRGGRDGYDAAGYQLAGAVASLLDDLDDDERAAKLEALSALFWRPGPNGLVRSFNGFLASPDAGAVIAWLERELPRCMGLIPARRRSTFLAGFFRFVVEEENDITVW